MRMKSIAVLSATAVLGAALGWAAAAASYQKTGTVKEVAADSFTLDLGKEEWRFYTEGATTGKEALKAGDKVTVTYKQVATKIEGKGGAKKEAAKAPAKKK
ncbi:MAG: hypothetical protein IPP58_04435 [Holophagaceae bacterium]|uniref:DUF5666 domain-containing protein n=1 Tax=Candidatus Geothrix skivensis TaxID=2954439 RepID=A0A9D7SFU9_9BACT|nr:hypothetical protein [Candidatus Geothrix skivensis]